MASRDKKLKKVWSGRAGKIRTLSDLNRHSAKSDTDSDDDEPQNHYYTGGGQKSRKLDQEPSKSNDVDAIFNEAKQVDDVERLLSGEIAHQHQPPTAAAHDIVFWSNGFTVDGGPLRILDDPENAHFLESIKKSECPKELEPVDGRSSVNVNLIRRNDKYTEPEKPHVLVPFQGVGRTLGVKGNISSTSTSGEPEEVTANSSAAPAPTPITSQVIVVDESLPSTSIQLRLADGTRLISRFNYNHRVSDICAFIDASKPEGGGGRNYELQMVGFPPKILSDETQTIEQAGLANSVVIQKF